MSTDPQHEHGSGVRPAGEPLGARAIVPAGVSKGVHALPQESYPRPKPRRVREVERTQSEAQRALDRAEGRRRSNRGRPHRPPPTQEMFDAPLDEG